MKTIRIDDIEKPQVSVREVSIDSLEQPKIQSQEQDQGFSFKNMAANIIPSAVNVAKDVYTAVAHPQQTKNAVTGMLGGFIQKIIPGEQDLEPYADAIFDFAVNRYGGIDKLKKTIETDPIGFVSDISSVLTGAGAIAKVSNASNAASILSKAGSVVDPVSVAAKTTGKAVEFISGSLPKTMYMHAASLPTTMPLKDRLAAVETALIKGIDLSPSGIDKIWKNVNKLDEKVNDIIVNERYKTASIDQINTHIDEVIDFYNEIPGSTTELKYLEKLKAKNLSQYGQSVSIEKLHSSKKKIYELLRETYNKSKPTKLVSDKGRMAFARGAVEEIGNLVREIKPILKEEGAYLNLYEAVKGAIPRIQNKKFGVFNPINIGLGAGAGAATGSPVVGIGAAATLLVLRDPVVQSRIAILLHKTKPVAPVLKKVPTELSNIAFQSGRITNTTSGQNESDLMDQLRMLNQKGLMR